MDANHRRSQQRPCGACGHNDTDHAIGDGRRGEYCKLEACDCGEYISAAPLGRRWKWTDDEIRRHLRRIAGLGHLHPKPADQELEEFAFGDGYIVDLAGSAKPKTHS